MFVDVCSTLPRFDPYQGWFGTSVCLIFFSLFVSFTMLFVSLTMPFLTVPFYLFFPSILSRMELPFFTCFNCIFTCHRLIVCSLDSSQKEYCSLAQQIYITEEIFEIWNNMQLLTLRRNLPQILRLPICLIGYTKIVIELKLQIQLIFLRKLPALLKRQEACGLHGSLSLHYPWSTCVTLTTRLKGFSIEI